MEKYAQFLISQNRRRILLTYRIPSSLSFLTRGHLCFVSVKGKEHIGILWRFEEEKPSFSCVDVIDIVFSKPLPTNLLSLVEWVSSYYLTPIELSAQLLCPGFVWNKEQKKIPSPSEKIKKESLKIKKEKGVRKQDLSSLESAVPLSENPLLSLNPEIKQELPFLPKLKRSLNEEQKSCYLRIKEIGIEKPILLQGVTGSGKTEVYIHLIIDTLIQEKRALILLPEIVLTPLMTKRFQEVFHDKVAIIHSGLRPKEYEREWERIFKGDASVILGVRTAIFSPLEKIGLIIVDEEHDTSYKSENMPCFHARDMAVVRAKKEGAICLLGSATPSLDSLWNVKQEKYGFVELSQKHHKTITPVIELIETPIRAFRSSQLIHREKNMLDPHIVELIQKTKEDGFQSLVIINRRGFTSYRFCPTCKEPVRCPHCSVSLTMHKKATIERCHYCGYEQKSAQKCSLCHGKLVQMGIGTEGIEDELKEKIPQLNFARLDRDTVSSHSKLTEILTQYTEHKIDCLIGTQMLSKGHDFPGVKLVVLLHIEDGLFIPEFRAGEKTFQLLYQSIGRAGRHGEAGHIILQSLKTDHPIIEAALNQDISSFVTGELKLRQLAFLPPFSRMILIEIQSKNENYIKEISEKITQKIFLFLQDQKVSPQDIKVAGPHPAIIERIQKNYRYQISLIFSKRLHPRQVIPIDDLLKSQNSHFKIICDVDPISTL